MKILFINQYGGINGVQVGILNRHNGLKAFNVDSDFLCLHAKQNITIAKDSDLNIYYESDGAVIMDIILKNRYDIISSIDCPDVHRILDRLPDNIKIYCEVRNSKEESRKYLRKGNLPLRTRCIVTPSEFFKEIIEREIEGQKNIPIYVIPNFVPDRFLYAEHKINRIFPVKYIGWIGRFDENKNYREVLQIADEMSYQRYDVEFLLVGNYPANYDGKFIDEVRVLKNRINFKWLPFIEYSKIHNFFRLLRDSGGCYLSTSKGETFSNTALESMASRCAVVTSDIENFNELLDNCKCGFIYKLGDIKGAVKNLNMVLDNVSIRQSVVDKAYEKVRKNYTADSVILKWKGLFDSLA